MNQLLKGKLFLAFLLFCACSLSAQSVYINEINYLGAAETHFVEVVSPTGEDLSGWTVTVYNDSGFAVETINLAAQPTTQSGTKDIIVVDVILFTDPGAVSIETASDEVIQFVSWGDEQINSTTDGTGTGTGTAQDGPAVNTTPDQIGVQGPLALGSLQLTGEGTEYADFTWQTVTPTTSGIINGGLLEDGVTMVEQTFLVSTPVDLLHFKAQLADRNIIIHWATASEFNSFYYLLERSVNGAAFTEVNRTEAAGFSEERLDYRFIDQNPPSGVIYYRLTQVDFDGMSATYDVVAVTNQNEKAEPVVYPNPVDQQLQIAFPEPLEDIRVEIFEITSRRLVHTQKIDQTGYQLTMDCSQLEAGQYLVRLSAPRYLVERRFVKLTK